MRINFIIKRQVPVYKLKPDLSNFKCNKKW